MARPPFVALPSVLAAVSLVLAAGAARAEESPFVVQATPGCTVKLSGALSGEHPCAVTARRSDGQVLLEIAGPAPWDPTAPEERPLTFSVVVRFEGKPETRTYRGEEDGAQGSVVVMQKAPQPAQFSEAGPLEATVASFAEKGGPFVELHGTLSGQLVRSSNKGPPVSIDVRF
jgi:hypothetical protein